MHALTLHAPGDVRHESVPDPVLRLPSDTIVRVLKTAVCGSDLHGYHGREIGLDPGTIVGHEFVGEVLEVGEQVRSVRPGDVVVGAFSTSCGNCVACNRGLTARCLAGGEVFGWVSSGTGLQGAQAERVRVPLADGTLVKCPPELDLELALLAGDVLSTGLFCAEAGGVGPGQTVVVLGAGPVGLAAVMAARAMGAEVVMNIDRIPGRLQQAERFGARPVHLDDDDVVAIVREAGGGLGADAVLEVVGSKAATRLAYEIVRPGGTISAVGVHTESNLAFTAGEAYDKNLTYRAGRCSARAMMQRALGLMTSGVIDPSPMITHRMPLSAGPNAYALFAARAEGCQKIVLEP
ncbi:MAG: alcohol dehydrogenase catalytic domain-containing protein [bacterium]|nr:alcohol dehydrogenase catalytic domain-containing protein [bacterium]